MNLPQEMEKFLDSARQGEAVDARVFTEFARGFETILIYGAGNLGTAIGKHLQNLGVNITAYWDVQADTIKTRNGVQVVPSFGGGFDPNTSLVIFAITNDMIAPSLRRRMGQSGWNHVLLGEDLLYAFLCPLFKDTTPDPEICNRMTICDMCTCKRLRNIFRSHIAKRKHVAESELVYSRYLGLIINTVCSLKCRHCNMYMNSYPKNKRLNVDTEKVLQDITILMQAVDGFGHIRMYGGEPFLHKGIDRIIEYLLTFRNYASLFIVSNGGVKINSKMLAVMKNPRVRLDFSNYVHVYNKRQNINFSLNLESVKGNAIYSYHQNALPNWSTPSTLRDKHRTLAEKCDRKSACEIALACHNGKLFPCQFSLSLFALGVADYPTDYVVLDAQKPVAKIRENIRRLLSQPCYQSCGHCGDNDSGGLVPAAEQGFDARYTIPIRPQ
jgi:organic radical activating enzyme